MSTITTLTTLTTLTTASHIEALGPGGANGAAAYKRPLSSSSAPSLPAKRLALPTSELQQQQSKSSSSRFPATTARPDQRVNVRVPVARACYSRLLPGQVAFVNRHFGRGHVGAATGPGGLTHVASLEELNDMLAIEDNHVVLGAGSSANDLFRKMDARDLHRTSVNKAGKRVRTRLSFNGFDALAVVPNAQHPLHQFALDGLVATRVEEVDDEQQRDTYSSASAQQACIVAVQGHAPMRLAHVPGEVGTGVMDMHQRGQTAPSHAFLQPVRILAKVYVVLVAVLVVDSEQRYRLQYETVSSSNLDVDPRYASSAHKLFRTTMRTPNGSRGPVLKGDRVVLRATELGSVVDTHFGPRDQPQLVVCVRVVPYEPTRVAMMEVASKEAPNKSNSSNSCPVSVPKDVYVTFVKPSNPRLAKANAVKGCVESKKQRQQNAGSSLPGSKGVPTGISSAEFDKLQNSISDMRTLLLNMAKEVNESKQREQNLEQRIVELSKASERSEQMSEQRSEQREQTRKKNGALRLKILQDLDKKIDDFLEAQGRRATDAAELLVKDRILEWVEAYLQGKEGNVQDVRTEDDKLKEFAVEIIDRLRLADEREQPPYEEFDEELVDGPRVS